MTHSEENQELPQRIDTQAPRAAHHPLSFELSTSSKLLCFALLARIFLFILLYFSKFFKTEFSSSVNSVSVLREKFSPS